MHNSRVVVHTDNLDRCLRTCINHSFRLSIAISTSRNSDISMRVIIEAIVRPNIQLPSLSEKENSHHPLQVYGCAVTDIQ